MAPPGPPPYTSDQISAMTSPEERLRARAELTSYIARMKKEQEERLDREASSSEYPPRSPYRNSSGTTYTSTHNTYHNPATGPYRRGSTYTRGARSVYHPYQRPSPYAGQHTFKNKSATFNNAEPSSDSAETNGEAAPNNGYANFRAHSTNKPKKLCSAFTLTGVCTRHGCYHLHDPDKQAACRSWLLSGKCPKGDSCPLSHNPSPHNAPTCLHFQEGRCNNDECNFAHVRINPAAPNCEAFGLLRYCEKGSECAELHAPECPYFSNTGTCRFGDKCRLGHVHRASRMRALRTPEERMSPSEDLVEGTNGKSDTDGRADEDKDQSTPDPQEFTQQADYVPLGSED